MKNKVSLFQYKMSLNRGRDPGKLATFRDPQCKKSEQMITESLKGHYQDRVMKNLRRKAAQMSFALVSAPDEGALSANSVA